MRSHPLRYLTVRYLTVLGVGALGAFAALSLLSLIETRVAGQVESEQVSGYTARTLDGKPNLTGLWQAMSTAYRDLQDHGPQPSPFFQLGALGATPMGQGVVQGNEIPYQPWAAVRKEENSLNRLTLDPALRCYLPGIPRAMYMPFPFQIVHGTDEIYMAFPFATSDRIVYMATPKEAAVHTWMGTSNGHWEGDTLVISAGSFNDQTWFDQAGNFHSDDLQLVERITPITPDALRYEVTVEDPKVFTRPWTMSLVLYRRLEENVQLPEFKCVPFAEELIYGYLRKYPTP